MYFCFVLFVYSVIVCLFCFVCSVNVYVSIMCLIYSV